LVLNKLANMGEGRKRKRYEGIAAEVNTFEPVIEALSDDELHAKTAEFRTRFRGGESLDDLMPEAFACVREAARRSIGQRHFDVQLMGGAGLHSGMIAEMKTGEGKTLTSTLASYLNALSGDGVHVVTVNDYLAKRDSEWMSAIFRSLGISVGLIQAQMRPAERRPAYAADITYGTNSEFGFDYLRDSMAMRPADLVQRGHAFAIVDEVDSILIDEARTPLIISGQVADSAKWYTTFARLVPRLIAETDYEVDEPKRTVAVLETGIDKVEGSLGIENLYDQVNSNLVHHLYNALQAKELYRRDVDYLVDHGEVKIVDEFTGRVLEGRRYSEGLHQAIEAKEGVRIKEENQTLATITIQNYFRMYAKLSGMTGTAKTQLTEFEEVYKLGVVEIPTNQPMIRDDEQDLIYKNEEAKWNAVADDITERSAKGQPVQVGTVSIEKSERLSGVLNRRGIEHHILNAKNHEKEAMIVAQAGRKGSVTVATNMAGRGVDILLGGNAEYLARQEMAAREWDNDAYLLYEIDEEDRAAYEAEYQPIYDKFKSQADAEHDEVVGIGGLYVLGTERHESRRIDNQLRGRSGRQGDPGESLFYLSLEDDLMRLFASDRVASIMNKLNWPDDEPIVAKMVSRAIESAQRQVEELNFERRKNVLEYDEVMNEQRKVIYGEREKILQGDDLKDEALDMVAETVNAAVATYVSSEIYAEEWDLDGLVALLGGIYPVSLTTADLHGLDDPGGVTQKVLDDALGVYDRREQEVGGSTMRSLERAVLLNVTDTLWREHLSQMDYLREGIGLRAYGQRDPKVEYKMEAFGMFTELKDSIREEFARYIYRVEVVRGEEKASPRQKRVQTNQDEVEGDVAGTASEEGGGKGGMVNPQQATSDKVPRNAPCPCGSGRKYKKCHGATA